MATYPEICPIEEIIAYLGLGATLSDADQGLLTMLKGHVEDAARRYVRHGITQPTTSYVEYHPRSDRAAFGEEILSLSGTTVTLNRQSDNGHVIVLGNGFVRSITTVYEDFDAYFGQDASDFAAATLLTSGSDYYLLTENTVGGTALSKSGMLIRRSGNWPNRAGTVKVTYVAGFTAAELDDQFRDIKLAIMEEVVNTFKIAKSRAGVDPGGGPVESFSIGGQVSISYDTSSTMTSQFGLSKMALARLRPYRHLKMDA